MLKYHFYMCRMTAMNAIDQAIDHFGSVTKMAQNLGVSPQAVCFWRDGKRRIPADKCPDIERGTVGRVTCEALRPDVDWGYLRSTHQPTATEPAAAGV